MRGRMQVTAGERNISAAASSWRSSPEIAVNSNDWVARSVGALIKQDRSYFGDFDPFGDFQLIFGASRLGLKIVEIPNADRTAAYRQEDTSIW